MFDKIFVINLKDRPDRLERFTKRFNEAGFDKSFEVFEGIVEDPPSWYSMSKGFWGCHRSHRTIFQLFLESNWDNILVFEDDAKFCPNFKEKFNRIKIPNDWDMLYLGGKAINTRVQRISDGIVRCLNINLMHAYSINRKVIRKLCDFYDNHWFRQDGKNYIYQLNDWKLGELHPQINAYLCLPNLVGQEEGFSSTENRYYKERVYEDV